MRLRPDFRDAFTDSLVHSLDFLKGLTDVHVLYYYLFIYLIKSRSAIIGGRAEMIRVLRHEKLRRLTVE